MFLLGSVGWVGLGLALLGAQTVGCILIDSEGEPLTDEHDAVVLFSEVTRGELVEHVIADQLGVAVERVAVAAARGGR